MKHLNITALLIISLLLVSCDDDLPVGSGSSGKISGDVQLFYQHGNQATDNSGVTVSIKGTSLSAVSDVDGLWTIKHVPAGVYTIVYEKPGYGRMETQNVQFGGHDEYIVGQRHMGEIPTFSITSYNIEWKAYADYAVTGTFSIPGLHWVGVFYKTDPNADFKYTESEMIAYGLTPIDADPPTVFHASFSRGGLPSGTTFYIQLVPITYVSPSLRYYDYETGERFITGLGLDGASPVIPVTLP